MGSSPVEYKGCVILPMATRQSEDWHNGAYEIWKDGELVRFRINLFPGSFYRSAAVAQSIEDAKLEIDNLFGSNGDISG